jgi:hypothetical protein
MGSTQQTRHWPGADTSLIRGIEEGGNFKITKSEKLAQK